MAPELADAIVEASFTQPRMVRVKEVFESVETFLAIEKFLIDANKHQKVSRIIDVACGHGLVGLLVAYRFPGREVLCSDIQQRDSFENYRRAFDSKGSRKSHSEWEAVMQNVKFVEADLRDLTEHIDSETCMMVIHGCNEVRPHLPPTIMNFGASKSIIKSLFCRSASSTPTSVVASLRHQACCGLNLDCFSSTGIST